MTKFNVNESVWVRLNPKGREILWREHERFYASIGRPGTPYITPKEDADGWSKWQLWSLMADFGPHMHMGGDTPFETTICLTDPAIVVENLVK